jgi:hypothetical protein
VENDPLTGEQTVIADTGFSSWGGLDWHPQRGKLYGIPTQTTDPRLATLDPATGEVEIIGPITLDGVQAGFSEATAFDPHTRRLIAAVSVQPDTVPGDFTSELLVSLDPDTAVATLIAPLAETGTTTSQLRPGEGDGDELEFVGGRLILTDGNGAAPSVEVLVNGLLVSLDADGQALLPTGGSGVLIIQVTVTDGAGNSTIETTALAVTDPTDVTPPVAALEAPDDLAEVTYVEDLIGTATDDANFFRYRIGMARGTDQPFRLLAEGFAPVVSDVLTTLDPTLLENGIYRVRLVAEDVNGATAVDERAYRVTGAAKIGVLQLSFLDLAISVSGIDIELVRTYDSRRRGAFDDLGFGWKLELRAASVTHNRPPGEGWILSQTGPFDALCQQTTETRSHLTEVRLSDEEFYVFKLGVDGTALFAGGCEGEARFDTLGGSARGRVRQRAGWRRAHKRRERQLSDLLGRRNPAFVWAFSHIPARFPRPHRAGDGSERSHPPLRL